MKQAPKNQPTPNHRLDRLWSRQHARPRTFCATLLACLLITLAHLFSHAPALAQSGQATPASPSIETTTSKGTDSDIRRRIKAIFSEIDNLRRLTVDVNAGVVTLGGNVTSPEAAQEAEKLAKRVEGVVTVENKIDRAVSIDENIRPVLERLQADSRRLINMVPLALLAFAIGAVIAAVGFLLANRAKFWRSISPNNFLAEIFATSCRITFIALGLFVALDILNATAALGAILGGAGIIGLAIGFAVRDSVDNYVSSIMLSIRQPFRAQDHVVIGPHEGLIVRLTSRATILMTLDGNHLRIPNATVFKSEILNYTRNPERRFDFDLGIDADDDPVDGIEVATDAVSELDFVLKDPPPSAHVKEVGDSNIVLTVTGWVDQSETDFLKARSVAIRAAKTHLEAAGFALPEPIYRLRFDERSAFPAFPTTDTAPTAPRPSSRKRPSSRQPAPIEDEDVSRDTHIERKVAEERSASNMGDLLSSDQPIE